MFQQLLLTVAIVLIAYVNLRPKRQEAPLIRHGASFSLFNLDAKVCIMSAYW